MMPLNNYCETSLEVEYGLYQLMKVHHTVYQLCASTDL